ncbi:mitochondrial uncoupling protein 4 [Drosophila virilis]|uniref:CG18418-PA n=1 Tax=Drosophila virilis TaxID=7244 RepID=B4LTT7_DROVI|nr:mitochondrial uncoupling protein 4 [Drosophila virilis]EDW63988.1 uncharacterized protein Dvir_GJ17214 [Drosophila virilis]
MGKPDRWPLEGYSAVEVNNVVNYETSRLVEICITSFLSAVNADLIVYPLDVTKTRLQIQGEHGNPYANMAKYRGLFGTALGVIKEEGFLKLYSGFSALVLRHSFVSGLKIGSYDYLRSKWSVRTDDKVTISMPCTMLAGIVSGALSTIASNPLDLVKLQMQMESKRILLGMPPRSTGIMQALQFIYSQGGLRSLYRGLGPNIMRASLFSLGGISFYDLGKRNIKKLLNSEENLLVQFLAAMVAGFFCSALSCPADVVKSRIMNQPVDDQGRPLRYKNSIDCLQQLVKEEGPMAIYKGFMPYWIRCGPWFLVFWMSFEGIRRFNGYGTF